MSTYESASTRRFRLGRVDNIRANSPAALEWVQAMLAKTETTVTNIFTVGATYIKRAIPYPHIKILAILLQLKKIRFFLHLTAKEKFNVFLCKCSQESSVNNILH